MSSNDDNKTIDEILAIGMTLSFMIPYAGPAVAATLQALQVMFPTNKPNTQDIDMNLLSSKVFSDDNLIAEAAKYMLSTFPQEYENQTEDLSIYDEIIKFCEPSTSDCLATIMDGYQKIIWPKHAGAFKISKDDFHALQDNFSFFYTGASAQISMYAYQPYYEAKKFNLNEISDASCIPNMVGQAVDYCNSLMYYQFMATQHRIRNCYLSTNTVSDQGTSETCWCAIDDALGICNNYWSKDDAINDLIQLRDAAINDTQSLINSVSATDKTIWNSFSLNWWSLVMSYLPYTAEQGAGYSLAMPESPTFTSWVYDKSQVKHADSDYWGKNTLLVYYIVITNSANVDSLPGKPLFIKTSTDNYGVNLSVPPDETNIAKSMTVYKSVISLEADDSGKYAKMPTDYFKVGSALIGAQGGMVADTEKLTLHGS